MRLYPKRLRNIDDLEREKKQLLQKSKKLDQDDFLSVDGLLGKKSSGGKSDKKKKEGGSTVEAIIDMLPISNPLVSMGIKLAHRLIAKKDRKPKVVYAPLPTAEKKSRVRTTAVEFIGGYLKWKAIELSYKGIRRLLNRSKERG